MYFNANVLIRKRNAFQCVFANSHATACTHIAHIGRFGWFWIVEYIWNEISGKRTGTGTFSTCILLRNIEIEHYKAYYMRSLFHRIHISVCDSLSVIHPFYCTLRGAAKKAYKTSTDKSFMWKPSMTLMTMRLLMLMIHTKTHAHNNAYITH